MNDNTVRRQLPPHLVIPASVTSLLVLILYIAKDSIPLFFFVAGIVGVVVSTGYIVVATTRQWEKDDKQVNKQNAAHLECAQQFNFSVQDGFVLPASPKSDDTAEKKISWATIACPAALAVSLNKVTPFTASYFTDEKMQENLNVIRLGAEMHFKYNANGAIKMVDFGINALDKANLTSVDKRVILFLWRFFCEAFHLVLSDEKLQELIRNDKGTEQGAIRLFVGILKLALSYLSGKSQWPSLN